MTLETYIHGVIFPINATLRLISLTLVWTPQVGTSPDCTWALYQACTRLITRIKR